MIRFASPAPDPWNLLQHQTIDAMSLLRSIASSTFIATTDPRSRLLGRDGLKALERHWGSAIFNLRLRLVGVPDLKSRFAFPDNEGKFHTISERVMEATNPDVILRMLRQLGARTRSSVTLTLGGSTPLLLSSILIRKTDDIAVVDEVPESLRNDHELMQEMMDIFGLRLAHFQSHYLPSGWETRVRLLGVFGRLTVNEVDTLDILITKLFSRRSKDLRDLNEAWNLIDVDKFRDRIASATAPLRRDERSLEAAQHNWYVLTGENSLPELTQH